jgi:hypothetical protein
MISIIFDFDSVYQLGEGQDRVLIDTLYQREDEDE